MAPPKLKFSDYDALGFDLDHTVSKYNLPEMYELVCSCMAKFLTEKRGYSKDLLQSFDINKDFYTKGLIHDVETGTFLKLDERGRVLRASHGSRFMDAAEIERTFGKDRIWEHAEELLNNVRNIGEGRYRMFENYFDMPCAIICSRIVDILDKKAGGRPEKYSYWHDIIDALNDAYIPHAFAAGTGGYFPALRKDIKRYVRPCSKQVKRWFKGLKQEKRTVFIMTSAYVDSGTLLLEHILGPDWKDYFDLFLFHARKPGFFNLDRPFLRLEGDMEKEPVERLETGNSYSQGNLPDFLEYLRGVSGNENPKVCYFGDSLRSDVFPSKKFADWETVYILEEMDAEGMVGIGNQIKEIEENGDSHSKKLKNLSYSGPPEDEKQLLLSKQWGSFFYDDSLLSSKSSAAGKKTLNTFWGYVIRKYSDITVPNLEYFADFPFDHKYEVFDHEDPSMSGFHPSKPNSLI